MAGTLISPKVSGLSISLQESRILLKVLFYTSLTAYIVWFGDILRNPSLLLEVIYGNKGATYKVRETYETMPGITTLTQLSILYSCLYALLPDKDRSQRVMLYILVALTTFRAFFWSERLALIEVVIPIVIVGCLAVRRGKARCIVSLMPLIGIAGILILFALFEYHRTWVNHYINIYDNYFEFVTSRVFSYYYLALNSGAGLINELGAGQNTPFYTLQSLYRLPMLGELIYNYMEPGNPTRDFLYRFADPEFNNMSGVFTVIYDYGASAFVVFFLIGFLARITYRSFISAELSWLSLMYPIFFISLIELLRVNYIFSVRVFPVFAFAFAYCISKFIFSRASR
ncbi:hypothetical protein [Ferrimonas pelagia]|uniref:hypothetical protein n=1 Tax=Ferrimonas pelagia TaxID=1177826 RepID=UPI0031E7C3A5